MKALLTLIAASSLFAATAIASPERDTTADLLEMKEVATQIEQAVDRKDWETARFFFTDEIRVDFTSLVGGEPMTIPADALISGWASNLKGEKESFHMRGDMVITITGDTAVGVSNGYAWNKLAGGPEDEGDLWEVWGTYTHGFIRTPEGWRVNDFTFDAHYERGSNWVKTTPGS